MRSLKRDGRSGVVVPNGFLFGDGVAARIKAQLLRDFNLHTIIRLPNGVFAPYTSPNEFAFLRSSFGFVGSRYAPKCTGLLDSDATDEIWFY